MRRALAVMSLLIVAFLGCAGEVAVEIQETVEIAETTEAPTETAQETTEAVETRTPRKEGKAEMVAQVLEREIKEATEPPTAPPPRIVIYSVAGIILDPNVGTYLKAQLDSAGIGWWMPYALCCAFQESRFNTRAVSRNGKDKGLFQYREQYWDYGRGDIFDPYAQIRLYVTQTANRLRAGLGIEETISRHMTSDFGEYNQEYVNQVLQWLNRVEIR